MLTASYMKSGNRLLTTLMVAATVLLLSACASIPEASPESALTDAREAIATAEQAGARQYAGAELDEAQQKLNLAEEAVVDEEMGKAERIAQEALVVAELALARTESAKAEEINQQLRSSTEALIEEMQRVGE